MEQVTKQPKQKLIRYSSHVVSEIISEYQKGQQTVKEFCAEKGINTGTFYCWLSKRRNTKRPKSRPAFVPVKIKEDTAEEKVFAEYKGLKFYQPVSVEFLKSLIN
jgi:hypothetical protein